MMVVCEERAPQAVEESLDGTGPELSRLPFWL